MAINIPAIPIQPVPIRGGVNVVPQIPPHTDPSQIIMQAAQMRQQRDLAEQEIQQRGLAMINQAIQGAAALSEHKREAIENERMAQITHDIAIQKLTGEQALTAAHTQLLEAQGEYFRGKAKMMGGGLESTMDSMIQQMQPDSITGKIHMAPSQAGTITSRWPPEAKLAWAGKLADSGIDQTASEALYKKQLAEAATAGGTPVQLPAAMAKSVSNLTADLADRAEKIGLTSYPIINKGIIAYKSQTGDPDMSDYLLRNMEAQKQLAQVFMSGGVPTDFASRSAADALRPDAAPNAMRMITEATIPSMVGSRLQALGTIGPQGATLSGSGIVPRNGAVAPRMMRVRQKSSGTTGNIPAAEFDPSQYEPL